MNEQETLKHIADRLTRIQIDDLTKAENQICVILEGAGYLKEVEKDGDHYFVPANG